MISIVADPASVKEFSDVVDGLITSAIGTKCVRKAVMAGLRVVGKEQKRRTPFSGGRTKNRISYDPTSGKVRYPGKILQRSTGKGRFSRGTGRRASQQIVVAKVGMNVAVKKSGPDEGARFFAHHAHLVALGTKQRFTKRGAYRGRMPRNPYIRQATHATAGQALEAVAESLRRDLPAMVEAAKR